MKRRHSRRSGSRSARKLRWVQSQYCDSLGMNTDTTVATADHSWVSGWLKWPGDRLFGTTELGGATATLVEPSDETLVKTIISVIASVGAGDLVPLVLTNPIFVVIGLIAFDGGADPDFFNGGIFDQSVIMAPPNPATDGDDDWIIRIPIPFVSTGQFATTTAESYIVSRAMRKLPPGKGVLAVIAPSDPNGQAGTSVIGWGIDARMAIKSGYTR